MWVRIWYRSVAGSAGAAAAARAAGVAGAAAVLAASWLFAACSRQSASDTLEGSVAAAESLGASAGASGGEPSCPLSGAWRSCSVLDRLEAAGLVVERRDAAASFPFFSVAGETYEVSRALVHVFLYPDAAARRRDTDALDSSAVAPRGAGGGGGGGGDGAFVWPEPPTLVTSNNLAAVVLSPNERQTERIVLALSAGLPASRR
ncbi:MAG: hypothetical protein ACT4R6_07545 [Gemmatimonadaceae bacterium]